MAGNLSVNDWLLFSTRIDNYLDEQTLHYSKISNASLFQWMGYDFRTDAGENYYQSATGLPFGTNTHYVCIVICRALGRTYIMRA